MKIEAHFCVPPLRREVVISQLVCPENVFFRLRSYLNIEDISDMTLEPQKRINIFFIVGFRRDNGITDVFIGLVRSVNPQKLY